MKSTIRQEFRFSKRLKHGVRKLLTPILNSALAPVIDRILRRSLDLTPALDLSNFEFKMAETVDEFQQAFQLVYQCYRDREFVGHKKCGVHLYPQHALKSTSVLIVKQGSQVVGTVSLITDNPLRLPAEKAFNLDFVKKEGTRWAEVSTLAIDKKFRRSSGPAIIFGMFSFLYRFAIDRMGITGLIAAIYPWHVPFYRGLLLFEHCEKLGTKTILGEPASIVFLNLVKAPEEYDKIYGSQKPNRNLSHFCATREFKEFSFGAELDKRSESEGVFTLPHFKEFILKTNLLYSLSFGQFQTLIELLPYKEEIDLNSLIQPKNLNQSRRHCINGPATFCQNGEYHEVYLRDISTSGIGFSSRSIKSNDHGDIIIRRGDKLWQLEIELVWMKGESFGYRFIKASPIISELLLNKEHSDEFGQRNSYPEKAKIRNKIEVA